MAQSRQRERLRRPRFRFEPDISLPPTDRHAGAPTGLEVKLKVLQRNDEVKKREELYAQNGNVKAISTPPIKKTVITLPEGMTINPSAAQGLEGCTCPDRPRHQRTGRHALKPPSTGR